MQIVILKRLFAPYARCDLSQLAQERAHAEQLAAQQDAADTERRKAEQYAAHIAQACSAPASLAFLRLLVRTLNLLDWLMKWARLISAVSTPLPSPPPPSGIVVCRCQVYQEQLATLQARLLSAMGANVALQKQVLRDKGQRIGGGWVEREGAGGSQTQARVPLMHLPCSSLGDCFFVLRIARKCTARTCARQPRWQFGRTVARAGRP